MLHVTYILHVYMLNLALLTILSSILPSYRLSRVKICTIGIKVVLLFASYIHLQSSRHEDDSKYKKSASRFWPFGPA